MFVIKFWCTARPLVFTNANLIDVYTFVDHLLPTTSGQSDWRAIYGIKDRHLAQNNVSLDQRFSLGSDFYH